MEQNSSSNTGEKFFSQNFKQAIFVFIILIFSVAISFGYFLFFHRGQSSDEIIVVKNGMTLEELADILKDANIIRSKTMFKLCVEVYGEDTKIKQGPYVFKEPSTVCAIANRFLQGKSEMPTIKFTIPEGMSNQGVATLAEKNFVQFNKTSFLEKADKEEGYLFPETYFLFPTATEDDIISMMKKEFFIRIQPFEQSIKDSGRTLEDIVIMASIVEKEAKTTLDQEIIAGILWKRIEMNMPLQVDAPFYYFLGKTSKEITQTDLRTDSPYNTYRRKGLPVGPIGNPGENAIYATILPKESPYLYYLSDNNDIIHYAKTFKEHKKNKEKYLQ